MLETNFQAFALHLLRLSITSIRRSDKPLGV
uniref:Uncharacterized protein n=1 Tax=Rhizophora mucronata TaxID=61149 RepID=A0A2P2LJE5_RHIMU